MCISLCSYMMCFEGSSRLMEEEKSPIRLNGTLILSFLPWIFHLCIYPPSWVCSVLMHSPYIRLSALCRTGSGEIKGLKKMAIFV